MEPRPAQRTAEVSPEIASESAASAEGPAAAHRDHRRGLELSGIAILVLCLGVGLLMLFAADPYVPPWLWVLLLVGCLGGLILAVAEHFGRWTQHLLYAVSVLCSWALLLSLPNQGMIVVILVVVAAAGSYLLPIRAVLGVIGLNCAVVMLHLMFHGVEPAEYLTVTAFYAVIHLASMFSTYALYRESLLRAELEEKNLDLETAGVLLEDSAKTAERLRISRELHDAVGHQLTVLNLELEAAAHRVEESSQGRAHVERAQQVAKDLLGEVRGTVGELRRRSPGDLEDHLRRLAAAVPSLEIHVEVAGDLPELDEQRQEALLRAAQEMITNAVRHAEAQELSLELLQEEGETMLRGTDDGYPPKSITFGNGLSGLQERVRLLGGELGVVTRPAFTVEVRLP